MIPFRSTTTGCSLLLAVALVFIIGITSAAASSDSDNCISLGGMCMPLSAISTHCSDAEAYPGIGCPSQGICCLEAGVLCHSHGGSCVPSGTCKNGKFIAADYKCGESTVCCVDAIHSNTPALTKANQAPDAVVGAQETPIIISNFSDSADPILSISFATIIFAILTIALCIFTSDSKTLKSFRIARSSTKKGK